MDISSSIKNALLKALITLGVSNPEPSLEFPSDLTHGDFSTNVALVYGKRNGKNPRAFADEIVAKLSSIEGVSKIEVAGHGFINFHLAPEYFLEVQKEILMSGDMWGAGIEYAGKQVMIEYTDPNPFKAFHIGHLMSNAIGESLSRIIENAGAKVIRANYQGDVGVHVACAIWGIQKLSIRPESADDFGRAYAAGAIAYKDDEEARKDIDDINKKLYDRSDKGLNELYDSGRKASLEAFERVYAVLGTKFDHYFFESEVGPVGKRIVEEHPEVFLESEGAIVFKGEEYGLHTRVFVNSQGLPTYEAKELGLEKMKMDLYPKTDEIVIVTGNEIIGYFKVLKKAMEFVYPEIAAKLKHVPHGMLKLTTGKMSSRTGYVITGESLLRELGEAARARAVDSRAENVEKLSENVAVAAIKYQILKQGIGRDIIFDKAQALSLEGDSGPYIQYAHARCFALLEKGKESGVIDVMGSDTHILPKTGSNVLSVQQLLVRFPHIAARAAKEMAPQHIAGYLIELSSAFNSWYAQEQILDGTVDASRKLAVVAAVATTLKKGLSLLGIEAPDRM